ncbi:MAG: hypothetical protein J5598_01725 [Clostridia bacterium]|nr:hypothetical protein [Clostridia bacterium]
MTETPKAYMWNDTTFNFEAEVDRQRDPLESERVGHDVWLMPGNSTLTPPPEEKEGFDRHWNKDNEEWEYVEKKKDPEPEPYVPTELDEARNKMWEYGQKLADTDYIDNKMVEAIVAEDTEELEVLKVKYATELEQRKEWRIEKKRWMNRVAELEAEELAKNTAEVNGIADGSDGQA